MEVKYTTLSDEDKRLLGLLQEVKDSELISNELKKKPIYAGDTVDNSGPLHKQWEAFDFEDPTELVCFFDSFINLGKINLHKWQAEIGQELAQAKPTSQHPYKFALCAANGSGKDKFIIVPFVIWFAMCKVRSLSIITSSSGVQLTAQTENHVKQLAEAANAHFGESIFKINQRFIKCLKSGSEIRFFATDEAGKAEGYHPLEPGAEMAIIVNEGKSVTPDIFGALRRCTGYNYWLNVSSPGEPSADFYRAFTNWKHKRKVDFYDCPHMSQEDFDEDKRELGEHSALFRSKWLALFTTVGGNVVISQDSIEKCIKVNQFQEYNHKFKHWPKRVGIDLAAGGDENSVQIWIGNKRVFHEEWREKDTTLTADRIDRILTSQQIPKDHSYIKADDGGVGHAIIDMLRRKGWSIRRVLNQSAAKRKKNEFGNHGAEMWFSVGRLIEEQLILLPIDDSKLVEQLGQRYYKQQASQGRITLQSKIEAKAEGKPSPDRADGMVLALEDLRVEDFLADDKVVSNAKLRSKLGITQEEIQKNFDNIIYDTEFKNEVEQKASARGSLNVILKNQTKKLLPFEQKN